MDLKSKLSLCDALSSQHNQHYNSSEKLCIAACENSTASDHVQHPEMGILALYILYTAAFGCFTELI